MWGLHGHAFVVTRSVSLVFTLSHEMAGALTILPSSAYSGQNIYFGMGNFEGRWFFFWLYCIALKMKKLLFLISRAAIAS
jgi:hypothetical protein